MRQPIAPSQGEFAAALLDPARACAHGLRTWNGSDPMARLAVHRNNVVSSLLDALADTFPVVQELVGIEFFRAMAAAFVRQSPPRSRILAHFGRPFPHFIEHFVPARAVPYLADMARLEMARVEAYHAADVPALSPGAARMALASGDRIGELRLVCRPGVGLVRSQHPVASLWAAHQDGSDLGDVDPDQPEDALVLRVGLEVLVLRLPRGGAEFAETLLRGGSLADAASAASTAVPGFDVSALLSLLMSHGALTSIHLPEKCHS